MSDTTSGGQTCNDQPSYQSALHPEGHGSGQAVFSPRLPSCACVGCEPIKVSSYGGYFEDMLSQYAYPAFTKDTGIEVETISQPGGFQWFVTLKNSIAAGSPAVDVTMAAQGSMRRITEIFVPLDENSIPNLQNVPEYLILRDDEESPIGAPVLAWYATFVTNTERWPEPPVSWGDAGTRSSRTNLDGGAR